MKKIILILTVFISGFMGLQAQIIESIPAEITEQTKDIRIIYHSDQGNAGLKDYTGEVYAHTGVITNFSTSSKDWKHAPTWGDNAEKYHLTRTAANTYELIIPDIRSYYNITSTDEKVTRLAFVFRSADKSREGKTASGGDIFLELGAREPVTPSPQANYPGGKPRPGFISQGEDVIFCLPAPGKQSVSIVGAWNDYKPELMSFQDYESQRYFWIKITGLAPNRDYPYYYSVDGESAVGDPYATLVLDPYNDQYLTGYPYPDALKGNDIMLAVYRGDRDDYNWKINDFKIPETKDLVIYELLLRDFTGTPGQAKAEGTLKSAMDRLDYLKNLGVNAVELMPVMEYSGNNSWGYNPNFYFALDKAYGTPDDMKAFVDACHERGMAVILDVVFNHVDGLNPWVQMYPSGDNPFINARAPHDYSVFNDWRQENPLVRQMQDDCLKYWMTAYKIDGFRFDLVKGMGDSDSYANGTEAYNTSRVANMARLRKVMAEINPHAIHINENLASATEENEMAKTGQLNWSNINSQSRQYAAGYEANSATSGFFAPNYSRTWGSTIAYAESHDEERLGYEQTQRGANDYVKRNHETQITRLGSLAAQMLMSPGPKMIWQFQEMGNSQTTKQSSGDNNTGAKIVPDWDNLDEYQSALVQTYTELIAIRKNAPMLFDEDATVTHMCSQAAWAGGRFISLKSGNKELVLMVNPDLKNTLTLSFNASVLTSANCQLLSASYNTTPSATFSGSYINCSLKPGAYAIFATKDISAIEDNFADSSENAQKYIYDLNGRQVTGDNLRSGVYIIKQGNTTRKVVISQ